VRFVLVAVGIGAAVGLSRTGRPRHGVDRPVRLWPVLLSGLVLQLAAGRIDDGTAVTLLLLSYLLLVAFALANLAVVGMWLVALGVTLNFAVIALNDGMPVRPAALVEAGVTGPEEVATFQPAGQRHIEGIGDRLTVLADVVPVRPLREVLSFGDLILAVGVADVLATLLRRRGAGAAEPAPRLWYPAPAEP